MVSPKTVTEGPGRLLQEILKIVSKEILFKMSGAGRRPNLVKENVVENVVCRGGHQCPQGMTCCTLSSDEWGCCPFPNAVCCSDGLHCCPQGYTCDVSNGTCIKDGETIQVIQKRPTARLKNKNVVCPDEVSECPDNSTCCQLHTGDWNCCPFPEAVCCSDDQHCCPKNHTCDVTHKICKKEGRTILMSRKTPAMSRSTELANVVCPDEESECPEGETCCLLASGAYGCCPLPEAVCCRDKLHCCPRGYECNLVAKTCSKGIVSLPLALKKKSLKRVNEVNRKHLSLETPAVIISQKSIVCPDGTTKCLEGETCCKLNTGKYGCCPLPDAVCCSDGAHCCPHGYICNITDASCTQGGKSLAPFQKTLALKLTSREKVIVCSDDQTSCPDGYTCCKVSLHRYGCCPLPSAVCCGDLIHCCPNGYTCDVSSGYCQQGRKIVPLSKKIPALNSRLGNRRNRGELLKPAIIASPLSSDKRVKNIVCPDESTCPDSYTCCEVSGGGYGCCPLPNAVCCCDLIHCCPNGYTCSSGECKQGRKTVPLSKKIPALNSRLGNRRNKGELFKPAVIPSPLSSDKRVKNIVCPDGSMCPDSYTCCEVSGGGYGCCPFPNAVCCSDLIHCCPNGYTCSPGMCEQGRKTVPLSKKIPALNSRLGNRRNKGELFKPAVIPSPLSSDKRVKNIVCPDESTCPDSYTCCEVSGGGYGCCPLPNAVCCCDLIHCCPNGYTCSSGECKQGRKTVPLSKKIPALNSRLGNRRNKGELFKPAVIPSPLSSDKRVKNIVCPDGSMCPDSYTCCEVSGGGYGCCHFPNAVCCSDLIHCCPNGYTCSSGMCEQGRKTVPLSKKIPALNSRLGNRRNKGELFKPAVIPSPLSSDKRVKNIVCPDGSMCPDSYTCCEVSGGGYGCCHFPNAVCCSDLIHCCPNGYTCSSGMCEQGRKTVPLSKKIPALNSRLGNRRNKGELFKPAVIPSPLSSDKRVKNIVCPDGSMCPDSYTCCEVSGGGYGCCHFPNAVCCSDLIHCCPNGYTCSSGMCEQGRKTVPLSKKIPALNSRLGNRRNKGELFKPAVIPSPLSSDKRVKNIVCPDGSMCPDSYTCCEVSGGGYGCCHFPNAVCCSDLIHCCPNGYTCSPGMCEQGRKTVPLSKKIPALNSRLGNRRNKGELFKPAVIPSPLSSDKRVKNIVCPDGSMCPDSYTCCEVSGGGYGCCHFPNAVCCSDLIHCCPNGYTCSSGMCEQGRKTVPLSKKIPALNSRLGNRRNKGELFKPAVIPSPLSSDKRVKNIVCPDGSMCPDSYTCCEVSGGGYGCCHFPNAVCCSDLIHCCPNGYTCSSGMCEQGRKTVPLSKKIPALNSRLGNRRNKGELFKPAVIPSPLSSDKRVKNIVCPDGSMCPDSYTCCEVSGGGYGCCPFPNAVCCSDLIHCCPNGYTCSPGMCEQGRKTVPLSKKIPALNSRLGNRRNKGELFKPAVIPSPLSSDKRVKNIVCPDGSMCPDSYTCCEVSGGGYGCCPFPNAVCCSDLIHCCPNGYTCSPGMCERGRKTVPLSKKIPALNSRLGNRRNKGELFKPAVIASPLSSDKRVKNIVCPDESTCPDSYTCCEVSGGGYGCCPLPNAVCCCDLIHCCPNGYTCSSGMCEQGRKTVPLSKKIPALNSRLGNRRNKGELFKPAVIPSPLSSDKRVKNIVCPDGSMCPDSYTCCEVSGGGYGCCHFPNAVCCSDLIHCCPNGYTCSSGMCEQGRKTVPLSKKIPALNSGLGGSSNNEELSKTVGIASSLKQRNQVGALVNIPAVLIKTGWCTTWPL